MKAVAALAATFWLTSACSSAPLEPEHESTSFESFGVLTADALCALAFGCCSADERGALPASETECRVRVAAELNDEFLPTISSGVAKGRILYERTRYEACLARVVSAGCEMAPTYADCLAEGLVPLVAAGGPCDSQVQCINSACIGATRDLPGVCGAALPNGLSCSQNLECESKACVGRVCRARMGEGRSCFADSECESEHCDGLAHVCVPPSRTFCD